MSNKQPSISYKKSLFLSSKLVFIGFAIKLISNLFFRFYKYKDLYRQFQATDHKGALIFTMIATLVLLYFFVVLLFSIGHYLYKKKKK